MVGGAIVAGLTDLTYNTMGYIWVSICVVSTAVYLLLIKKLKDLTGEFVYSFLCEHLGFHLRGAHRSLSAADQDVQGPQRWLAFFQLFVCGVGGTVGRKGAGAAVYGGDGGWGRAGSRGSEERHAKAV